MPGRERPARREAEAKDDLAATSGRGGSTPYVPISSLPNAVVARLLSGGALQAKLTVGAAGDALEVEADRAADAVVARASSGRLSAPGAAPGLATEAPPSVSAAIGTGGRPLDEAARLRMESAFGHDFSDVRVHLDSDAPAQIGALAFTAGTDIVFAPARYRPGTANGDHLLGHELAHVVQQRAAGPGAVRRQPDDEGAVDPAAQAALLASLAAPRLSSDDQARLRTAIGSTEAYRLVEQRHAVLRRLDREESRGMGIVRYTAQNQQLLAGIEQQLGAELARLGLPTEQALVDLVDVEVPQRVLARARQIADTMLQQNLDVVITEKERYAQQVCSPDLDGLLAVDAELGERANRIASARNEIETAQMYLPSAGVPDTAADYGIPPSQESLLVVLSDLPGYEERLTQMEADLAAVRGRYGARYPILLSESYQPGSFSAAPVDQLGKVTGEPLDEIIENIGDVREAIADDELKIWTVRQVVAAAMQELGVSDPVLVTSVEAHIRRQQEDAAFLATLKGVMAITTTLAALVLGSPAAAALVGAAWSAEAAHESIGAYLRESAASNTALDPQIRDISMNEPELLWVVLDLIGLGLDLGAVVGALRPLARAALRSGQLAEFQAALRQLPERAATRLMASLRSRLGMAAVEAEAAAEAAARLSGAGKTLDEYVDALRVEGATRGGAGIGWDHANQPRGLTESQWRPGDPIDMPTSTGSYPPYDTARRRYWRNRANSELAARARGETVRQPGRTTDPVAGLSDVDLAATRDSGRAPEYAYPNRAGQTWELEHSGVPQRVRDWLVDTGAFTRDEARRAIQESSPGALLEVTPLEHSFFDAEAQNFGNLRADADGVHWPGSQAADERLVRPLRPMSDDQVRQLATDLAGRRPDFTRTAGTRQLRDALNTEIQERGLGLPPI